MTSDPPNLGPEAREQEIERLAQELGRLIQGADPERRQDLRELATALMREEFIHKDDPEPGDGPTPAPFNPLIHSKNGCGGLPEEGIAVALEPAKLRRRLGSL